MLVVYFIVAPLLLASLLGWIVLFTAHLEEKGVSFSVEKKWFVYCDEEGYMYTHIERLGETRLYYEDDTPVMCEKQAR